MVYVCSLFVFICHITGNFQMTFNFKIFKVIESSKINPNGKSKLTCSYSASNILSLVNSKLFIMQCKYCFVYDKLLASKWQQEITMRVKNI